MIQILTNENTNLLTSVIGLIGDLTNKLIEGIQFIKSLISFIPKILSIFPFELQALIIGSLTLVIFAFIYKFIT